MNLFIGCKMVKAIPMTREEYNLYRGWIIPVDENPDDAGYLVEYTDGGKSNHPAHEGYISWSPKEQFDNGYRSVSKMTFGLAIEALKRGLPVARQGWHGKDLMLYLVPKNSYPPQTPVALKFTSPGELVPYAAYLALKGQNGVVNTWAPSCADALAEDWYIVP